MTDPLSGTASVLAVVNFASQTCGCLYDLIRSYSEACKDLRHYAVTLEALQSSFRGISALESDVLDPSFFTQEFKSRTQECMLDLQALERLIKPTRTKCEDNSVGRIWARLRWASPDQKTKLRRCLDRIERHRTTFALDLLLLNIRLSLRPQKNLLVDPELYHQLRDLGLGGTSRKLHPSASGVGPTASAENISIRSSIFKFLENDVLHFHSWFGANTIQDSHSQAIISSNPSSPTNGYGITVAAAMYGCVPFRIEVAMHLLQDWKGRSFSLSVSWNLSLPKTITWDEYQVEAAASGDVDALKRMFSSGEATPYEVLPDGSTLLHVAASNNRTSMVRLLLQEGAKVNAMNDFGETPLHTSVALAKDYNISRLLLEYSADLHNRNAEGKTPLHTFFSPVMQQILCCHSAYIDLSTPDHTGMTLLHYLAWSSKTSGEDFRKHHQLSRTSLHARNAEGQTILHLAAQRGNLAIINYIAQTAKRLNELVNLKDCDGRTALHLATENKRAADAITLLLPIGADIRVRDHHGRSALHHAAKMGRIQAAETLVAALKPDTASKLFGADIWGMTPLMISASHENRDMTAWFREEMARLMLGSHSGESETLSMQIAPSSKEIPLDLPFQSRKSDDRTLSKRHWTWCPEIRITERLWQLPACYVLGLWLIASMVLVWRVGYFLLVAQ